MAIKPSCTPVETVAADGETVTEMGTTKFTALLAKLFTVTLMVPVVAPAGTGATIVVEFQLVGAAIVLEIPLLKLTMLNPCELPKFVPVIVTNVPTSPDVGLRLVMVGSPLIVVAVATFE